jgi:hypothetical protein
LLSAIEWADLVFVFDTGSTDATPNILKRLSSIHHKIIYYKSEYRPYDFLVSNNEVFAHYFHLSSLGDWWCLLSTDELYAERIRPFISRIPYFYDCIWDLRVNFFFTELDLKHFISIYGSEIENDLPSMHNFYRSLRYYKADYSEPRFFKHTSSTSPTTLFTSSNFRHAWFDRALNLHYQYRFPSQIIQRVHSRRIIFNESSHLRIFNHEINFNRPTLCSNSSLQSCYPEELSSRIVESDSLNCFDPKAIISSSKLVVQHASLPSPPVTSKILINLLNTSLVYFSKKYLLAILTRLAMLSNYIISSIDSFVACVRSYSNNNRR